MVHIPSLLLGLSVVGSITATRLYGYDRPAKISLYDSHSAVEASSDPAELDCGEYRRPTIYSLTINTCLWGDFPLTHFRVTTMPVCASGAQPVAYFFPTISCTGNPSFRSDNQNINQEYHGLHDKCLSLNSPAQWSMIFSCDKLESKATASRHHVQAIPYNYNLNKTPIPTVLKASDAVITPHTSFDCTIWKPKEPTYLPADTCIAFEGREGRSVFIDKPAICADGSEALLELFREPGCGKELSEGNDGFTGWGGSFVSTKCYSSDSLIRSMRFRCGDKEMGMYEDLPPYKHAEVEPLVLHEAPMPTQDNGEPTLLVDPNSEKVLKPTFGSGISPQSSKPQGGKVESYYVENCKIEEGRSHSVSVRRADTCVWSFMYKSMEVTSPAVCANGTQALFATYSRPGCKSDDLKYLGDIPEEFTDGCADISNIDSFAFICEGLPETEIGNKGSVGGFLKFVGMVLLILILMIGLSIASCCLRGAAMMKQANELWARVMDAFKGREGAIQL